MKLLSFLDGNRESWGAVVESGVVDLGRALPQYPTLADFLGSDDYAKRDAIVAQHRPTLALSDVKYLPVIPRPEKIVCAVRNYLDHHNEAVAFGMKREITEFPPIFLRVWRSQVGHNAPVIRPKVSDNFDWEGELAVVIGKGGRHISQADAWTHVAGYSIYNDVSVRDWQRHAQQIASGKNFVGTAPFGPWLVTPDEIGDPTKLKLETRVNGATVQSSDTSMLIFSIPRLIEYCSTIFDLVPGDVIATGTPAGVGFTRKPPVFLKPGDVVEVEIENIGVLRNPVVDEA
ncbi:fumarylacetoacetate hydrolase family protein [Bradyrhizobium centrosematis]|uniref:fumarylacetoacetate hydrolase family protein n=1 Tax=Bradyrhizobium centrosematis TaxID=1300039 RepID=UPI00216A5F33|nr:fumarylacetoacetate hydrolase family protein [Bradyrhizobium centrosematis]MCS3760721.1 2-keto-4-pentenoate hydratase/2-oxohepta-3-ene-1,7-dioic acid hydratase in catechol pathway [Bradyrhizobium centrosematis]MCS3771390.1 2-keto-4-pentenoate hydratase/2-oxohepta-3-ene-1,7-dioic acid hydratase in catechol pathway [Bradyrhizobium centrosematis]